MCTEKEVVMFDRLKALAVIGIASAISPIFWRFPAACRSRWATTPSEALAARGPPWNWMTRAPRPE